MLYRTGVLLSIFSLFGWSKTIYGLYLLNHGIERAKTGNYRTGKSPIATVYA